MELAAFQKISEQAARTGGAILVDMAGRAAVHEKGPSDLVTEADFASQRAIKDVLLGAFPNHGFLAEENESIPSQDQGLRWIVDPLDGTSNYVHGIPYYCVSIALEQAGTVLVGTIYDPLADQCFWAVRGGGAWKDGVRLAASQCEVLSHAVVAMSLPSNVQRGDRELNDMIEVSLRVQSMRRMGSAALNLCGVAAGRFDAFWSTSTKSWDIAAGVLLVQEAGGQVTGALGEPLVVDSGRFMATSTARLQAELLAVLRGTS